MNHRDKNKIRAASFEDTIAIGINSGLADYKLAWNLNKKLSIDFVRHEDIFADSAMFAFYYYTAGENSYVYNLVSLVSFDQTLLDFSPRLDYMLVIRNGITLQRVETIIRSIREIEGVGHAFLLDTGKGKAIRQALEIIELQEIYLIDQNKKRNSLEYVRQEALRKKNAQLSTEKPVNQLVY